MNTQDDPIAIAMERKRDERKRMWGDLRSAWTSRSTYGDYEMRLDVRTGAPAPLDFVQQEALNWLLDQRRDSPAFVATFRDAPDVQVIVLQYLKAAHHLDNAEAKAVGYEFLRLTSLD